MKVDIAIKETKDYAGELEGIDDINSPEDEEWARIINEKFVHNEKGVTLRLKGGEGSGNFGHGGRPGEVGGSASGDGMQFGETREIGIIWNKLTGDSPLTVERKRDSFLFSTAAGYISWSVRDDGTQHGYVRTARGARGYQTTKHEFDDYNKFRKDAKRRLLADMPDLSDLLKYVYKPIESEKKQLTLRLKEDK